MQWISYFFIAFALSLAVNIFFVFLLRKKRNEQRRKGISIGSLTPIGRLGGIGIVCSFLLVVVANPELVVTPQIRAILIGAVLVLAFGVWDDFKNISWSKQFLFQLTLGIVLLFSGFEINFFSNPFGEAIRFDFWHIKVAGHLISVAGSLLILFWIVLIMNAVNWCDGVDGIAGGVEILASLAIFFVSLRPEVNQPAVAILSLILLGSIGGFWWFNFSPARIEAGTSGSYFIGFALASLAIIAGTKIATALIVLAIPVMDALGVIFERLREKKAVTTGDRGARHLHYRLRNLGWSDWQILALYLGFIGLMFFLYFSLPYRSHRIGLLFVEGILILFFIWFISKKESQIKKI